MEKEVVIIGVGTRIEFWSKDKWKVYNNSDSFSADMLAENMTILGI